MPIKLAITDDHPLIIDGISNMLRSEQDIEITATYTTAAELMNGLKEQQPDVLLLDIKLPDQWGYEVAAEIVDKYPQVRIVALTSLDAPVVIKSMMHQGCLGYLLKGTDKATLINAIHHACNWEEFIESSLQQHLLRSNILKTQKAPVALLDLTRREKQILQLIVAGDTTQEIADKLFISPRTAETHRLTLLKKLDVKNTAGLVRIAITLGLID